MGWGHIRFSIVYLRIADYESTKNSRIHDQIFQFYRIHERKKCQFPPERAPLGVNFSCYKDFNLKTDNVLNNPNDYITPGKIQNKNPTLVI